jgi:hypothetical protein
MKLVYTTQDLAMLSHLKNVLEEQGIACVLRGQHLLGGVGELPPIECWPELWVVDEEREPEARSHIKALLSPAGTDDSPWACGECGEQSPGTFSECWQCGTASPALRAAC